MHCFSYIGEDVEWTCRFIFEYKKLSQGLSTVCIRQDSSNDSWVNTSQYLMTYDENSNGTSAEWFIWKEENWQRPANVSILSYPTLWLYYNNMQSVFEWFGCDKMTASYKKVSGGVTDIKEVKTNLSVQIHSTGKIIQVNNLTGKNAVVAVYGIDGVKVAEQTMASQTTTLEMPVSGFYIVSVKAGDEKPVTAKIIIK